MTDRQQRNAQAAVLIAIVCTGIAGIIGYVVQQNDVQQQRLNDHASAPAHAGGHERMKAIESDVDEIKRDVRETKQDVKLLLRRE